MTNDLKADPRTVGTIVAVGFAVLMALDNVYKVLPWTIRADAHHELELHDAKALHDGAQDIVRVLQNNQLDLQRGQAVLQGDMADQKAALQELVTGTNEMNRLLGEMRGIMSLRSGGGSE